MKIGGKTIYTRNPAHVYRDAEMVLLFRDGHTLQQIGDKFGITRERVRQCVTRMGLAAECGGQAIRSLLGARDRAAAKTAATEGRERRIHAKYGITLAEWREIGADARDAFQRQRYAASRRGIAWSLLLGQWWRIWQESGHWHERGRWLGQYCMARWADEGPYSTGNVYITTCSENLKHGFITKTGAMRALKAKATRDAKRKSHAA